MNGSSNPSSQAPAPFRIAIVGGAIGGLTAALFLDHFCSCSEHHQKNMSSTTTTTTHAAPTIAIDVYEQASEYREIGAGVGLGVNATRLLHAVPGLGEAMAAIEGRRDNSWFTFVRWDDGRRITHLDVPVYDMGRDGGAAAARPVSMARSEFLDVLLDKIRERRAARLHTKKRFVSVKDLGPAGVEITFQDGTTAEADLLIGSDGIHSEVRKAFIQGRALYSGKIAYRGIVPIDQLPTTGGEGDGDAWPGVSTTPGETNRAVMWLGPRKHFLVFPISRGRRLNIVAFVSRREDEITTDLRESWTATCDRRELEADFADAEPALRRVIGLLPARVSKWRINDHEPVPRWTFLGGKVALLGDACHATTPHQGAGAGQAVEDGYVLARALADWLAGGRGREGALGDWMELYQRVRLPRAQKVVATSRQAGDLYELQSPDLVHLSFDEALPIVAERLQDRMKWIWGEDLDAIYEKQRLEAGLYTEAA